MKNKNENEKKEILQRIARYLMLHGSFANNAGLLNGKIGIAVFFYHYARYTQKKIYEDFAGELIDQIYDEIHLDYPRDFKNGLCGIAWGMEYLIRNDFVRANPDEVLEDLDIQIVERDVRRINDNSLETGLKGIAYYIISRLANREGAKCFIYEEYIIDLIRALERNIASDAENGVLIIQLKNILNHIPSIETNDWLFNLITKIKYSKSTLFEASRPLGIGNNGYTGIGLKLMWEDQL